MNIAIGTKNKAKIKAIEEVLSEIWENNNFIPIETNSKVSLQPLSDIEGIKGAKNRAYEALEKVNSADYSIGLEGFVHTNGYGMFLGGAVAILNKKNELGIGISGLIQLPEYISKKIKEGEELGPLIQNILKDKNNEIRHSSGTNGILTKDLYTRVDEFKTATKCALARFVSKEFYS